LLSCAWEERRFRRIEAEPFAAVIHAKIKHLLKVIFVVVTCMNKEREISRYKSKYKRSVEVYSEIGEKNKMRDSRMDGIRSQSRRWVRVAISL